MIKKLLKKFSHPIEGFVSTIESEISFQIQLVAALLAYITLFWLHASLVWVAIFSLSIGVVLALELMNTALEKSLDRLHPEENELIRWAKDAAAASVLIACVTSVIIFVCFLLERY